MEINNDVDIFDESSDIDYDDDKWSVEFDKDIFHGLKKNASTITDVSIDCYHSFFHSIDWKEVVIVLQIILISRSYAYMGYTSYESKIMSCQKENNFKTSSRAYIGIVLLQHYL